MDQESTRIGSPALTREEQRQAYLEGEWGNFLTTTPKGRRVLNAFQVPLFSIFAPRGVAVLTTTGRKTGKRRRNCIRAIRAGDKLFLVSLRGRYGGWYRNMMADPHVSVRIRGGRFRGTARHIRDEVEYAEARHVYTDTVNFFDRLEYLNHRRGRPTPDRIRALHSRWFSVCLPLVIDLEAASRRGTSTGPP